MAHLLSEPSRAGLRDVNHASSSNAQLMPAEEGQAQAMVPRMNNESSLFTAAAHVRVDGENAFTSAGGNIVTVNPFINLSIPTPGAVTVPASPPPTGPQVEDISYNMANLRIEQTEAEHDSEVYARLLLPKRLGWPLWIPRPLQSLPESYRIEGLSIGDVGTVTIDGEFDFLFNICRPADDPINRNRVPSSFVPIHPAVDPVKDVNADVKAWKLGEYALNGSLHETNTGRNSGDQTLFNFEGSASEGALLLLPRGGSRKNLLTTADFHDYAGQNAESWYQFVNTPRRRGGFGRTVANGTLYLVTGVDKTSSWGTCAFSGVRGTGAFPLTLHKAGSPTGEGECTYRWRSSCFAATKYGPDDSPTETQEQQNQCTFIRGFRMAVPESVWESLLGKVDVAAIINSTAESLLSKSSFIPYGAKGFSGFKSYFGPSYTSGTRAGPSGTSRLITTEGGGTSNPTQETVIILKDDLELPKGLHPSDTINAFLLTQNKEARVAVTHDDVWCSVLKDDLDALPSPNDLLELICKTHEMIVRNGVISFQLIPEEVQSPRGPIESANPRQEYLELIRTATTMLCKEFIKKPPYLSKSSAGATDWDKIENRMEELRRAERVWSKRPMTPGLETDSCFSSLELERERGLFCDSLRDGFILCHLINKLQLDFVIEPDSRDEENAYLSNVHRFLAACSTYGLDENDLFSQEDLVEGTWEALARVAKAVITLVKYIETLRDERSKLISGSPVPIPSHRTSVDSSSPGASTSSPTALPPSPVPPYSQRSLPWGDLPFGSYDDILFEDSDHDEAEGTESPERLDPIEIPRSLLRPRPAGIISPRSSGLSSFSNSSVASFAWTESTATTDVSSIFDYSRSRSSVSSSRYSHDSAYSTSGLSPRKLAIVGHTQTNESPYLLPRLPARRAHQSLDASARTMSGTYSNNEALSNDQPRLRRMQLRGQFQSLESQGVRRPPRASFDDRLATGPERRPRMESMVLLGDSEIISGASDRLSSLRDSADGGAVRKTVVVREAGKPPIHFQLGNCIGRGQFGSVYRALNLDTAQMVAIKRIWLERLKEEDVTALMREVDLLKTLAHPSIIKYEGLQRDEDTLNIILEYAENGSLGHRLRAFGKLSERLVASYVIQILQGLHYLHGIRVVHCDLKAANILIMSNGNVKLSDFGTSANLRAMEHEQKDVVGTPNWMAPEVIELKGASTKSDIWSLGCTIIELLTGRPPYAEIANALSVMFRVVEDAMPPLPEDCSPQLEDFLRQCFHKDPSKRPSAEILFEHPWLKGNWDLQELRPQDSIPFLRRANANMDKQRLEDSFIPPSPVAKQASDSKVSSSGGDNESSPRAHSFVKTTFGKPVVCRVCLQQVKKSAVLCSECSLISHSKCAASAPSTCGLRAQLLLYAKYAEPGSPKSLYPKPTDDLAKAPPGSPLDVARPGTSQSQTSVEVAPPVSPPSTNKLMSAFKRFRRPSENAHKPSESCSSQDKPKPGSRIS